MKDPLKQGLKLPEKHADGINWHIVEVKDPLKQGLKPFFSPLEA